MTPTEITARAVRTDMTDLGTIVRVAYLEGWRSSMREADYILWKNWGATLPDLRVLLKKAEEKAGHDAK